ncbi:uncharacterized protein LOC116029593 [Ipomoea triloba]|uniref:uncharacterized protein LOC116029593 n=1 Tax=Ipomoea triloba TaxID=35885 RepID=UPI00125D370F|nr:uncharacterized protein LOC116029593 [Ipomoea triloba]
MGDFNDIRCPSEKIGHHPQPCWLMDGFNFAITSSGISDLEIQGHKFTWDRGRGTPHWVQECLDRVLASQPWLDLFGEVVAESAITPVSDHLPIFMHLIPTVKVRRKSKFKFKNLWIKESECRALVANTWVASRGADLISRLGTCSKALWDSGRNLSKDFQPNINQCLKDMDALRHQSDNIGLLAFSATQKKCIHLLHQQNTYWKQRAKAFWHKNGYMNSNFFHKSV